MEAPDKIYMPNELLSEEWQRHIEGEDTCYIRKDILLEWLESVKHVYELPINGRDASKICSSKADAFQMVIDKLNSM